MQPGPSRRPRRQPRCLGCVGNAIWCLGRGDPEGDPGASMESLHGQMARCRDRNKDPRLQQERRFLMKVLDSYGDNYRASQFTILLEDEGSQGTDAPTTGNAENEPPEKEGLSPPRRTPAPMEASSPAPGPWRGAQQLEEAASATRRGPGGSPADSRAGPHTDKGGGRLWLQSGQGSGLKLGFSGARKVAALPHPSQLPL
uniref:Uncharacterized protein n=1 Tax=Myotis myotis TaxID=51298 RepID=A0A7J7XZU8_MYOMY|nr:hypothetical protein mMyoMyo1_011400 [Myotis myotis]